MATLDQIRAAEAEFLSTLASLRTRVERQNQAIVDLIARGNITPAEAEAINQRAVQTNQDIQALQPLLRRTLDLVNEGAGFFNRPAVNEIGTRVRDTVSSFSALAGQAGANRQEMNRLATANQTATEDAVDAKAGADQGPKTDSAGETASESQQANDDRADTQAPSGPSEQANATGEISVASTDTVPSNADQTQALQTEPVNTPPKLPAGNVSTSGGFRIEIQGVAPQSVALQVTNPEISALEENNNLVSYIYQATQVISRFQGGKFTQDIEGVQIFFPSKVSSTSREAPARAVPAPAVPVNQSTAETQRLQNVAKSQPQQTVAVTAATPGEYNSGVSYANQVGAEFAAFEGSGEIPESTFARAVQAQPRVLPSSSFAAEGFVDPTAVNDESEISTVSPLQTSPPTTDGASVGTRDRSAQADSINGVLGSQSRLRAAQIELAENQRLLTAIEQKIANNQGDPRLNSQLSTLYKNNIQRLQGVISQIQVQLSGRGVPAAGDINIVPQQGAREY
jgi:hypothetical protein